MGGEIKLSEKEKWAAYFAEILKVAGYSDASKYLHVMAYGRHRPIDDFPIGLLANDRDYVKIVNACIAAQNEMKSMPIKHVSKQPAKVTLEEARNQVNRTFKPTLAEDMHGHNNDEEQKPV